MKPQMKNGGIRELFVFFILGCLLLTLLLPGCSQPPAQPAPEPSEVEVPPAPPTTPKPPARTPVPVPHRGGGPTPNRPWFRLETNATMLKQFYMPSETVDIQFTFTNKDTVSGVISPFPPAIDISTASPLGGYSQKIILSFNASNEMVTLEPGGVKTYSFSWNQENSDGGQVAPGWYSIVVMPNGWVASDPGAAVRLSWGNISFLIQYPQGAMEKTIAVNESQTVGDITVTLKQVEMTTEFTKFEFIAPPAPKPTSNNGTTPIPTPSGPAPVPVPAPNPPLGYALYELDDGIAKEAGSGHGFSGFKVNPIPSDARVITLIITSIGWGQGPWEFRIPLQ